MSDNKFQELETDVRDLLNQLAIKLKDIEKYQWDYESYPGEVLSEKEIWSSEQKKSVPNPEYSSEHNAKVYLGCVKAYVERALKDDPYYNVVENENKYHNSTCY